MRYKVRTNYEDKRINDALLQLESALALDAPPMRIECFDISTNHGTYTVASMVVFTNGRPDKGQYRRFKIKAQLDEANDFLSMQEVMSRRYCAERMADERFGNKPDLIILDGGKPQLTAALQQFDEMGIHDIAFAAWPSATRSCSCRGRTRVRWCCRAVGVAVSGQAGARRGAPLRHHVPPRAARQGHDGQHLGRGGRLRARAQEGAAQALQELQAPQGCKPRRTSLPPRWCPSKVANELYTRAAAV